MDYSEILDVYFLFQDFALSKIILIPYSLGKLQIRSTSNKCLISFSWLWQVPVPLRDTLHSQMFTPVCVGHMWPLFDYYIALGYGQNFKDVAVTDQFCNKHWFVKINRSESFLKIDLKVIISLKLYVVLWWFMLNFHSILTRKICAGTLLSKL